jgi:cytochrome c-type biogenesis protein CcmE
MRASCISRAKLRALIRQRAWWAERGAPKVAGPFRERTRELVERGAFPAALLVIGSAVLLLVLCGPSATYSIDVGDLLANPQASRMGRTMRVQGVLVSGSIVKRRARCEYLLLLKSNEGAKLPVRYLPEPSSNRNCVLPDVMCDLEYTDFSITVEGSAERTTAGVLFTAHTLFVKCPGKYWAPVNSSGRRRTREDCTPIPIVP